MPAQEEDDDGESFYPESGKKKKKTAEEEWDTDILEKILAKKPALFIQQLPHFH